MESEGETEGECERREWYRVAFYSRRRVHGGLGVATREREQRSMPLVGGAVLLLLTSAF